MVKRRKIFGGAATPGDDDDVHIACAVEVLDARGYFSWRLQTLHLRRVEQHIHTRMPPPQDVQDVLNCGAARRGNDSDVAGQYGNGFLASRIEKTFAGEFGLELLEGNLKRAR